MSSKILFYKFPVTTQVYLNLEESIDYIKTIQLIHKFIEKLYKADSLNIAMQDGIAAGQSVPHVHTHIIPRYLKDNYGDGIYDLLEKNENNLNSFYQNYCKPLTILEDNDRKPRTMEIMQDESNWLSTELENFIKELDDEEIKSY
ncbi:pyrophosphatase activity protein [[Candida] boidinii]|nr:pyrophosphatase activity protein [[Candida] boidinii]